MMEWLIVLGVGLLAGTHTATWGMYKDAPHEGFTWSTYVRSIFVSAAIAPVAYVLSGLNAFEAAHMVVLFGVIYVSERGVTEFYKVFWRDEDQSKYFIPMQFHILGDVVHSRWKRLAVGIPYAGVIIGLLFLMDWVQNTWTLEPFWLWAMAVGSIGGWVSALGGAWKDAPIEGFELFKFFRSPMVAALFALALTTLSGNLVLVAMAAEGFTVATLETYKTFFFPSKPRGKFANKPVTHPEMKRRRLYFVPVYVMIWATVLGGFAWAWGISA